MELVDVSMSISASDSIGLSDCSVDSLRSICENVLTLMGE